MATQMTARAAIENQHGIDQEGNIAKYASPYAGEPWYTPIIDKSDYEATFGEWHENGVIYLLVKLDLKNPAHCEVLQETGNTWFVVESLAGGHTAPFAQYADEADARNGFRELEDEFVRNGGNL